MSVNIDVPTSHEVRHETRVGRAWAEGSMLALRLGMGFVFLWAFLDKTFGWGYATPSARSWINGGSPTKGFLSNVAAGPFESTFHSMAGNVVVDWAFMLSLLGIGAGLILGVGLRIIAVGGSALMLLMWAAEWPLAKTLSNGDPSGSTNPIVDYHIIYALALIAIAAVPFARYLSLATWWDGVIGRQHWLR